MTTQKTLVLEDLDERHPGLTKPLAGSYAEAARVCLDRHHTSPILFEVDRTENSCKALTSWRVADAKMKLAYANETDTTEAGAYCVALAAVEVTDGLVAVGRAETGTGADYYLGESAEKLEDLEKSLRLEVSGVDQGNITALKGRLAQKVRQSKKGDSPLPAVAVVVGFSLSTVLTADVEAE